MTQTNSQAKPLPRLDYTSAGATRQQPRVLPDLTQTMIDTISPMQAEIDKLKEENQRLKAKAGQAVVQGLTLRVSKQGAVSVYGMGKWPVTLYKGQWERLLKEGQAILDFIEANKASLSVKD